MATDPKFRPSTSFAKQAVLNAEGQTAEFMKLLPEYILAPKVTAERLYIETMEKIMQQNPKIFVDAKSAPNMYLPFLKNMFSKTKMKDTSLAKQIDLDNKWKGTESMQNDGFTDTRDEMSNSRVMRGFRRNVE